MIDNEYINFIKSVLSIGGQLSMDYVGNSMLPTLPRVCRITICRPLDICAGKIFVYISQEQPAALVCHRLISFEGEKLIFKGDNRPYLDAPVTQDEVIGLCTSYEVDKKIFTLE